MIDTAGSDKGKLLQGDVVHSIEQVAFVASLAAMAATGLSALSHIGNPGSAAGLVTEEFTGVALMLALSAFYFLLARRWAVSWPIYAMESALVGSYAYYRAFVPLNHFVDVAVLAVFCCALFGIGEMLEDRNLKDYSAPVLTFAIVLAAGAPLVALGRGRLDDLNVSLFSFAALFFSAVCYRKRWKRAGYGAGIFYDIALWMWWIRTGWGIVDHPQLYLVPIGLSAILFAETNRRDFRSQDVNAFRTFGSLVIALSAAVPMWEFQSFGIWLFLLFASLAGIFAGIALRVQTFVWMGMVFFVFDVSYQLGRMGMQYAPAKWAIMVGLGILLLVFVALNEKKQLGMKMRLAFLEVRQWE